MFASSLWFDMRRTASLRMYGIGAMLWDYKVQLEMTAEVFGASSGHPPGVPFALQLWFRPPPAGDVYGSKNRRFLGHVECGVC